MIIKRKLSGSEIIKFLREYEITENLMNYFLDDKNTSINNPKIVFKFLGERLGTIEKTIEIFNKIEREYIYFFKDHEIFLRNTNSYNWVECISEKIEVTNFKHKSPEPEQIIIEGDSILNSVLIDDDDLPF